MCRSFSRRGKLDVPRFCLTSCVYLLLEALRSICGAAWNVLNFI